MRDKNLGGRLDLTRVTATATVSHRASKYISMRDRKNFSCGQKNESNPLENVNTRTYRARTALFRTWKYPVVHVK
jgi:hypothetical protein